MAVRVRNDGSILCAAKHPKAPGDIYINDTVMYWLCSHKLLVTEPMFSGARGGHDVHGQWWLKGEVPDDVTIDDWWLE